MWRIVRLDKTRPFRALGRRGLMLFMLGVLWVLFGVGIAAVPMSRFAGTGASTMLLAFLDEQFIGAVWIVAGIVAIITAFVRRRYRGHDAVGFNALLAPVVLWMIGYLWSFVTWVVTREDGRPASWIAVIVWLITCVFILLAAGWPDPDDPAYADERRP
jgi:hypothetical protein